MTDDRSRAARRGLVGGLAYLVVLGTLLLLAFALAQSKVLAKGPFVDAVDHDVLRLRVLDRFTIYVDTTFVPFTSDHATSFLLMVITGMALLAFALAVVGRPDDRKLAQFFLLTAIGATFLAFDEFVDLTEVLGYNVEALYIPDAVIYAPPLAAFAYVYRRTLAASRKVLNVLVAGAFLFAVAQGIDRLPNDRFEGIEEKLEVLATLVLAVGFAFLSVHHLAPDRE